MITAKESVLPSFTGDKYELYKTEQATTVDGKKVEVLRVDEVVSLTELQSRKEKLENQLQIINDKIKAIESLKK